MDPKDSAYKLADTVSLRFVQLVQGIVLFSLFHLWGFRSSFFPYLVILPP